MVYKYCEERFDLDGFEYFMESPDEQLKKYRKGLLIGQKGACKACSFSSKNCFIPGCKIHCSCKRPRVLWNERKCNWFCHSYNINGEKK